MLVINKIFNKRYITEYGYARPRNILAESVIELDDTLYYVFSGYFRNASINIEQHYQRVNSSSNLFNQELRQIAPKVYRPFQKFVYFSKPLPVDIRIAQLESKIRSRSSVAALFKMGNGDYGFAGLKNNNFNVSLQNKTIRSIHKIKDESVTEIVYFTPKEGVLDENFIERYRIVLPHNKIEVIEHNDSDTFTHTLIRRYDESDIRCDLDGKSCKAIDYVKELENYGIELDMGRTEIVMPSSKVRNALKLKVNRKLSAEGPVIKHKKSRDHKQRSEKLLKDILSTYEITEPLTAKNKNKIMEQLNQEIHTFGEPEASLSTDLSSLWVRIDKSIFNLKGMHHREKISTKLEEGLRTLLNYTISPAYSSLTIDQIVTILNLNNTKELADLVNINGSITESNKDAVIEKLIDLPEIEALDWYFIIKSKILEIAKNKFNDQDIADIIQCIMALDFRAIYPMILNKYGGRESINKQLNKLSEYSSVFMCVPAGVFPDIVFQTDQEIKSGLEIGTGADSKDPYYHKRRIATEIIKIKSNPLDFTSFNKYGFVSTKNYPYPLDAMNYGTVILEFSDHVKERSSLCIGDSFYTYNPIMQFGELNIDHFASNLLAPEHRGSGPVVFIANIRDLIVFLENISQNKQGLNVASLLRNSGKERGYIEAQIKGTLTLQDVKTVYLPSSIQTSLFNLLEDDANLPDHITFAIHEFADTDADIHDTYLDDIKSRVRR